ncbi:MAG: hypothetical protein M0023_11310 [Desulfobacteraceae bacterium]|nr:hypothetical protein [Desulfobacteraceae bacterium]
MPSPIKVTTANREVITAIRMMQSQDIRVEEEMRKAFPTDPYNLFIFAKDIATFSAALIAIIKAIKSVKEEPKSPARGIIRDTPHIIRCVRGYQT